jgi:uroporphyrinogen decarboxylase
LETAELVHMSKAKVEDGVHSMVPRDKMAYGARRLRDAYARVPGAPLYRREFGYYVMDRWKREGHVKDGDNLAEIFQYDPPGKYDLYGLGWCEAEFVPSFEVRIIEDRGEHEVEQDFAGRHVLYFKGRRSGFMPEYLDHPVKDMATWRDDVKWRLDPETPERWAKLDANMSAAKAGAAEGLMMSQHVIGAYMYLRSLIGPERLFYAFYDMPDVIHECMEQWFLLADAVTAAHQKHVAFDEIYFGEDICYNHGPLISPDMMHEFLMPYYARLVENVRKRQIDKSRHLYLQIDTDGYAVPVIGIYEEIGMDVMSPFEVAAGNDSVAIAREHPGLAMFGCIDKRVMAAGRRAIDKHLEAILPFMRERGGFIPTCDHGVPEEVSFENYLYYRKRAVELGG